MHRSQFRCNSALWIKWLILVLTLSGPGPVLAQTDDDYIRELEREADSIYIQRDEPLKPDVYRHLIDLRDKVTSSYNDTTNRYYKLSRSKQQAARSIYKAFLGENDQALERGREALRNYATSPVKDRQYQSRLQRDLYPLYRLKKKWDSAFILARKAVDFLQDSLGHSHPDLATIEFDIGKLYSGKGDVDGQIRQYQKALDISIASEGANNPNAALYEHHLALVYGFIGYYRKELQSYLNAIRRYEASDLKDKSNLAVAYGSLSTWYLQHGDYEKAEQYMIKYDKLCRNAKKDIGSWSNETFLGRTQVEVWYGFADLARQKGDTVKALMYNTKALDFLSNFDFNDPDNNPHNYSYFKEFVYLNWYYALNMRAALLRKSDPQKSRDVYQQAYQTILNASNPAPFLTNRIDLINSHIELGEIAEASEILEAEITDALIHKSYVDLIKLHAIQANLAVRSGDFNTMKASYNIAFRYFQKDPSLRIPIPSLKYEDCKPYGNTALVQLVQQASADYLEAYREKGTFGCLDASHSLGLLAAEMFSENFAHLVFTDRSYDSAARIYQRLLSTALSIENPATTLNVLDRIENMQSRLSWKKFMSSRHRRKLNIPDTILERESDLNSARHFYKKQLFTAKDPSETELQAWKERLLDIEREQRLLEYWYQEHYPAYYHQIQQRFQISELQQGLRKRQRLIRYVFADDDAYAFVLTKDSILLRWISERGDLDRMTRSLVQGLSNPNSAEYKRTAQTLFNMLLPPEILGHVAKDELVIVPDDMLFYVPFEALIDPKGSFLVELRKVRYAPSVLLLNEQRKANQTGKIRLGIFAPEYREQLPQPRNRNQTNALPGAGREARSIAALFDSDLFSGAQANKQQFLSEAPQYSLLHLAMHSDINNTNVDFSNLSFGPNPKQDKLYVSELYTMRFNAEMAVLSACNTGVGQLKKGEGLMNVSRAFTYAGVPSLIMSLWSVPDRETSKLMISFYEYLDKGKTKGEALRQAKLDYLENTRDPALRHPYYWAGFILSGNDAPVSSPPSYAWLLVIGTLVIFGFVFRKRLIKLLK